MVVSAFVLLAGCEKEKLPPKDYQYYKAHLDEAQTMMKLCMESQEKGKHLTEDEKFSCKEAISAWMLKPNKLEEHEGFKGGTLDRE